MAGNRPAGKSVRDGAVYKQRPGKSQLATSHNGCHFLLLLLTLLARLTIPLVSPGLGCTCQSALGCYVEASADRGEITVREAVGRRYTTMTTLGIQTQITLFAFIRRNTVI